MKIIRFQRNIPLQKFIDFNFPSFLLFISIQNSFQYRFYIRNWKHWTLFFIFKKNRSPFEHKIIKCMIYTVGFLRLSLVEYPESNMFILMQKLFCLSSFFRSGFEPINFTFKFVLSVEYLSLALVRLYPMLVVFMSQFVFDKMLWIKCFLLLLFSIVNNNSRYNHYNFPDSMNLIVFLIVWIHANSNIVFALKQTNTEIPSFWIFTPK